MNSSGERRIFAFSCAYNILLLKFFKDSRKNLLHLYVWIYCMVSNVYKMNTCILILLKLNNKILEAVYYAKVLMHA